MFQFGRFALMRSIFNRSGFPIRKSRDQFIFANPRSLSQLITSFIASESQGIPRVPFLTFFYYTAFCSVCMLFGSCSVYHHLATTLKPKQRPYCCFLFYYFFQYVKERSPRSRRRAVAGGNISPL